MPDSTLAIIPAKQSSNRVGGKNMRPLGGKPLVQWTIEAALGSRLVSNIIVATDDETIGEKCAEFCSVLYRPSELSADEANAVDVVLWALEKQLPPHLVVMLQPTSPFRTAQQIDEAISLFDGTHPVISVKHIHGRIYEKEPELSTAQLMAGHPGGWLKSNGAIYVDSPLNLETRGQFHSSNATPYVMDHLTSLEIDEELDWLLALAVMDKAGQSIQEVLDAARSGCRKCFQINPLTGKWERSPA